MLKIIFAIIVGYIIVKSYKFFKSLYTIVSSKKEDERVHNTSGSNSKIDKKDVIDAQFEDIDAKDKSSSNN